MPQEVCTHRHQNAQTIRADSVLTQMADGRQRVIAAAIEMCTIFGVQGESSHLCLGFMEEAEFRLSLEGWAGVPFAMITNKQQEQRPRSRNFQCTFTFFCLH